MLRFGLQALAKFAGSVLGALLLSAVIAVHETTGTGAFFLALAHQLAGMAHGAFGASAMTGAPALVELAAALPGSLFLLAAGGAIALGLGTPLGLLLGQRTGPFVQILASIPVFCAALGLAWLAFAFLHAGPAIKPMLALVVVAASGTFATQRILRRAAARLRHASFRAGLFRLGLGRWEIGLVYAAPPVFADFFANLGEVSLSLVSALCICEWLFTIPGAGLMLVKSIALQDWSAAALALLFFAFVTLLIHFLGRLAAFALIGDSP